MPSLRQQLVLLCCCCCFCYWVIEKRFVTNKPTYAWSERITWQGTLISDSLAPYSTIYRFKASGQRDCQTYLTTWTFLKQSSVKHLNYTIYFVANCPFARSCTVLDNLKGFYSVNIMYWPLYCPPHEAKRQVHTTKLDKRVPRSVKWDPPDLNTENGKSNC